MTTEPTPRSLTVPNLIDLADVVATSEPAPGFWAPFEPIRIVIFKSGVRGTYRVSPGSEMTSDLGPFIFERGAIHVRLSVCGKGFMDPAAVLEKLATMSLDQIQWGVYRSVEEGGSLDDGMYILDLMVSYQPFKPETVSID